MLENIPTSLGLDETEKTPMIYHPFIGGYLQFTTVNPSLSKKWKVSDDFICPCLSGLSAEQKTKNLRPEPPRHFTSRLLEWFGVLSIIGRHPTHWI